MRLSCKTDSKNYNIDECKNTDHFINSVIIKSHRRNDVGMQCLLPQLPTQPQPPPVEPTQPPRPTISPTLAGCK